MKRLARGRSARQQQFSFSVIVMRRTVAPQIHVEVLTPRTSDCDRVGDRDFKELIKLHEVIRVDPNPTRLMSLLKQRTCRWIPVQKEGRVKIQREGSHVQGKERGLRRNRLCQHPDLRLPAFRTVRRFYHLSHAVWGALSWQPEEAYTGM